jgi:hypothetical protein
MNVSKKAAFGTTRFCVDSAEINWCYIQPVYMICLFHYLSLPAHFNKLELLIQLNAYVCEIYY